MTQSAICPICSAAAEYEFSGRDLMFDLHDRHDYFGCTACGALFMHPMPSPLAIAGFYPPTYDIYEEDEKPPAPAWWKRLVLKQRFGYSHLDAGPFFGLFSPLAALSKEVTAPAFIKHGRLLDVGCGNGRFLRTMQTLGWDVSGVEFSDDGIRVCRKANLPVHHGDLQSADFPDAHFDVITVRHVIEHIPEPQSFARELSRILKPGGQLLMETPNSQALGRQWLSVNWFANEVPRHLFLYNPDNLRLLARQSGLHCDTLSLSTSPKILLNSLDYILQNRKKPSKRMASRRFLARIYVWLAQRSGKGDVIHASFIKPATSAA